MRGEANTEQLVTWVEEKTIASRMAKTPQESKKKKKKKKKKAVYDNFTIRNSFTIINFTENYQM